MKIKALKTFYSAIVNMVEDEVKDVEIDAYTFENWVENGLIEEVKQSGKKSVQTNEN
jgi:hypothetical protein